METKEIKTYVVTPSDGKVFKKITLVNDPDNEGKQIKLVDYASVVNLVATSKEDAESKVAELYTQVNLSEKEEYDKNQENQ